MLRKLAKKILTENTREFLWIRFQKISRFLSLRRFYQLLSEMVYISAAKKGRLRVPKKVTENLSNKNFELPSFNKVIVWGHKLSGNTYVYIQSSFFKAFQSLGYETYFFDDSDASKLLNFNFENSLFITEDQAQNNIPLIKSSKYILHHVNAEKYLKNDLSFINFSNYQKSCENGESPAHPGNSVIKVDDCAFWDEKSKTLYQPWATDLLPNEIDVNNFVRFDPTKKKIHYIGGIYDHNRENMERFGRAAREHNIKFVTGKNIGIKRSHKLVRNSYISVDIRGPWHIECGYLPCRVFKNISYGKFIGVNSENIHNILGDFVAYHPDASKLFDVTVDAYRNMKQKTMQDAMQYVKDKHTYVNRIHNLLKLLA